MSTIHIVGLGPGNPEHVTRETERLLTSGLPVILRTRHHPAVESLDPGTRWASCDDLYQAAAGFEAVYEAAARRVMEAAGAGDVVYAVPGHPLLAEQSVQRLLGLAGESGHDAKVYAALSFVDAAIAALGIDGADLQVCDALALRFDAQRPALIHQVHDRDSATAVKLALLEAYPANHAVTVVRAAGTPDQALRQTALAELDHAAWSYLDCLYLRALAPEADTRRFDGLDAIVRRLHADDGCPWDREQTHESLRHHLLEECYELLEAIDSGEPANIAEELGDVLLQVLMHAAVAERTDEFTLGDVIEGIAAKLVRRHPHVFGDKPTGTAEEVYQDWEALKKAEAPGKSVLGGVPPNLPALAAAQSIQGRVRRSGFDWPGHEGALEKLTEELREFAGAPDAASREAEFGDVLFAAAAVAQRLGIDAEQALRGTNQRFRERFAHLEAAAAARGLDTRDLPLDELLALWAAAKAARR